MQMGFGCMGRGMRVDGVGYVQECVWTAAGDGCVGMPCCREVGMYRMYCAPIQQRKTIQKDPMNVPASAWRRAFVSAAAAALRGGGASGRTGTGGAGCPVSHRYTPPCHEARAQATQQQKIL